MSELHLLTEPPDEITFPLDLETNTAEESLGHNSSDEQSVYTEDMRGVVYLEPSRVLAKLNKKSEKEGAEKILTADELRQIAQNSEEYGLSELEVEITNSLTTYLQTPRSEYYENEKYETEDILDNIYNFFKKESEANPRVDSDSLSAAIRRTALCVYKCCKIDPTETRSGAYKKVIGPFGVRADQFSKERDGFVYGLAQYPTRWDGNIYTHESTFEQREHKQQWRVTAGKNKLRSVPATPRIKQQQPKYKISPSGSDFEIFNEYKLITKMKKRFPELTIFPEVHEILNLSLYVEDIPYEVSSIYDKVSFNRMAELIEQLGVLWYETGIINTDIKKNNVRKRENGELVVVDWGCRLEGEPGMQQIRCKDFADAGFTFSCTPPEIIPGINRPDNAQYSEEAMADTEKVIVYGVSALLLQSLYEKELTLFALSVQKKGYVWPLEFNTGLIASYSSDTFLAMKEIDPTVKLSVEVETLLLRGLSPNPEERPSIEEMATVLRNAHY